jgi:putative flippase GtrA
VPGVITASLIIGLLWNYPVHRFFVFPDRSTNPASA